MKNLIFAAVFLTASMLCAQNKDSARGGSHAVVFDFDNLSLDSFEGGAGFKYWKSSRTAFTAKLRFTADKTDKKKSEQLMGEKNSLLRAGIDFGFERHVKIHTKISPYWGAAAGAGYERIENELIPSEYADRFSYGLNYNNGTKTELISFMLECSFGIEFFLLDEISIAGQYSIGAVYKFGKEKIVSNIVDDSRRISELNTGISSSSFILSIYF